MIRLHKYIFSIKGANVQIISGVKYQWYILKRHKKKILELAQNLVFRFLFVRHYFHLELHKLLKLAKIFIQFTKKKT